MLPTIKAFVLISGDNREEGTQERQCPKGQSWVEQQPRDINEVEFLGCGCRKKGESSHTPLKQGA